jgi:hypothetical protein
MGQGPRTGRGAGYCGPNDQPGFTTAGGRGGFGFGRGRGGGFGFGRGFGRGWGRGFGFFSQGSDAEADRLRAQVEELEARLARLEKKD